ncbi:MAG TPA: HAD-IA family hydrolase [Solirubrobacteraceae bacterium]|nr:HAD-IA family hydrolase [Solirubrobacteraceae bacterium]
MPAEPSSPPAAVFLDALGTLVRLEEPWGALVALLGERHAIAVSSAAARRAMLAEMAHYRRWCKLAADAAALADLRRACTRIVRSELSLPAAAISDDQLLATLLDALRFEAYGDARDALQRWRAGGLAAIVVSNWDISLHDVLHSTGLRDLLDGVVCSAEVGRAKPDPAVFHAALDLVGLPPELVVHIGDSLEEDVAGARAAGIEPILLHRDGGSLEAPEGVRVIASLREW